MRSEKNDSEFNRLLRACGDISHEIGAGMAYIGGIAVYLHAVNTDATASYAEATHDADFYIGVSDMSDLRDREEVTPNRRLSKSQLIRDGFEFDIYTERLSSLIVPYSAVMAERMFYDDIPVASLEHLCALKLEAYRDRYASAKGDKDAKDLLRLSMIVAAGGIAFDPYEVAIYITDEHKAMLLRVQNSTNALAMARGNAMVAKRIREGFAVFSKGIVCAIDHPELRPIPDESSSPSP